MKTTSLRFRFGSLFTFACAWIFLASQAVQASTFKVTNTNDGGVGSLRAAIEKANTSIDADTIVFALPPDAVRVISLRSRLPNLSTPMSISNTGAAVSIERNSIPLRGEGDFNIFSVTSGNVVTLEGLTITKGTVGGVSNNGGTLTMRNCIVRQNDGYGGVNNYAANGARAELTLQDCVFTGNRMVAEYQVLFASPGGGAIRNTAYANGAALVTITNCVFQQNSSVRGQLMGCPGGAIANYSVGGKASITMSYSTVENNSAEHNGGGGIYNATSAQTGAAELIVQNSTIRDNSGGGLNNYAYYATNADNTTATLEKTTLSGNQPNGAISNRGMLTLTNCTVSRNTAGGSSDGGGAGIFNSVGTASVTNCTFSANMLTGDARGQSVSNREGATFITANSLYHAVSPGVNFNNAGTFTSLGHNLCNDNAGGPLGTGPGGWLNGPGDQRITVPKINALAHNGGPTQTCSLQSDSPAIDAGDDAMAPVTDQRGRPRVGVSDIGAYEDETIP